MNNATDDVVDLEQVDRTDRELLVEFIRICREHKPVGQWPGERLCTAIERMMEREKPFRFIAETDMAPERGHNGRGGDADRPLNGPRRAAPRQPAAVVDEAMVDAAIAAQDAHWANDDNYPTRAPRSAKGDAELHDKLARGAMRAALTAALARAQGVDEAMVDRYLAAQAKAVQEIDNKWGNGGKAPSYIHPVREACRAGLTAALAGGAK